MPMTEAARLAASERMKAMRANQKTKKEAEQKLQDEMKADPALQEALAVKTNGASVQPLDQVLLIEAPAIRVTIDWETIPIPEGQAFYAILKNEFEKAGKILNARLMAEQEGFTCKMCHKHFAGRPGMTDLSWKDPETGLFPRVDLCSEVCVRNWDIFRTTERRDKYIREADQQRGA